MSYPRSTSTGVNRRGGRRPSRGRALTVSGLLTAAVLAALTGLLPTVATGFQVADAAVAKLVSPRVVRPATGAPDDWPTYLHDAARSSASSENILSTANVATIIQRWHAATGGAIAASPSIVNGVVYVGSWDGNEYALNGSTGAVLWKTFLGITNDPPCVPPTLGITSSATVANGVVYVGGGDANWYALNATNGAVLWKVFTGLNTQAGAHYNWSSPLLNGNSAYIGIASNCDAPLVQGQLLKVDLTTHQVTATANFVPNGQVGGGVWTSPTLDAATNTVFVSTGTLNLYTQTLSQAIVSLDGGTLAIKDHWQLPFEVAVSDSDWGTTPTLTVDGGGRQLLSVANKNGVLYTLDRNRLAAGPVWQYALAHGGDCPYCGDGTIASGVFVNGTLYYAGGDNVDGNGQGHHGSVSAFNPGTGQRLWYHATDQVIVGSITSVNGVVFVPDGNILEALDAATGNSLWTYQISGGTYGAPSISRGIVYIGSLDGQLHAFGLPTTPPPPPPGDPNCPPGWTCQDMATPAPGSEQVNADGSWTIKAIGAGGANSNQLRLITRGAAGNNQLVGRFLNQSSQGLRPQAGLQERESTDPNAPYYAAVMVPNDPIEHETQPKIVVSFRTVWGAPRVELTKVYPTPYPMWVMVTRRGDVFNTAFSTDGKFWNLIPGTQTTVVLPTTVVAGVAVNSGSTTVSGTAQVANVAIASPGTAAVNPKATAHPCPAGWSCGDTDDIAPQGDQQLANGTWTITGAGFDINKAPDDFHYVMQTLAGDGTISARVASVGNSSPGAKSGLMMRQSTDPGSPYYGIFLTAGNGAIVQWRSLNGINERATVPLPSLTAPAFVQLSRYTDTSVTPNIVYFSASTSADGVAWTAVPKSTQAIVMGNAPLVGMAATANKPVTTNPSVFTNVVINPTSTRPPGVCPTAFTCQDVGVGYAPGSQTYDGTTWSFQAGGPDIWDVYDMFHFVSQPMTADGTISARVASVGANPPFDDQFEKAGVMLRATNGPQSPYYGVFQTPKHGIAVQWRTSVAGQTNQILVPGFTPAYPVYLMVGRWTDPHAGGATYYTAYTSNDNKTFTAVPGSTMAIALPGTLLAGIAADSYQEKFQLPVSFDNFALFNTELAPPGACPSTLVGCADIGGATPTGAQTVNNGAVTVQGGGGDIWATADQFHLAWQSLAADGNVSAHLSSLTPTNPWTKAGVMIRASTDPGSAYYAMLLTPGNGIAVQYRMTAGAATSQLLLAGTAPAYLKVGRWTDTSRATPATYYTAYTSTDGTNWTPLPGSTVTMALPSPLLAGLAVTSHDTLNLATAVFDGFAVSAVGNPPPGVCPSGWACSDIGGATPAGAQNVSNGTWTVQAGGGDISDPADSFRLVAQTLPGDGGISAHVASQTNTNGWAKAGVTLRAGNDPAAPYYAVLVTPSNGVVVQYRSVQGGGTAFPAGLPGVAPLYLQITRTGTTYAAATSTDGVTWTPLAGSSATIPALTGSLVAGMAATSHNTTMLSTVVYDTVVIKGGAPA